MPTQVSVRHCTSAGWVMAQGLGESMSAPWARVVRDSLATQGRVRVRERSNVEFRERWVFIPSLGCTQPINYNGNLSARLC